MCVGAGENPGHCVVAKTFTAIVEAKEANEVMVDVKGIGAQEEGEGLGKDVGPAGSCGSGHRRKLCFADFDFFSETGYYKYKVSADDVSCLKPLSWRSPWILSGGCHEAGRQMMH